MGATKRPAYRVIAIDKRRSRDGRALEILGYYDPLTEPATVQLDRAKIDAWIGKGAQPSDTVVKLLRQSERIATAGAEVEKPKRATRAAKPKPSKKAQARAAAAAEAPAETVTPEEAATPEVAEAVEPVEQAEAPAAEEAPEAAPPADEPAAETEAATEEPAVDETATEEPAADDAEKADA